MSSKFNPANPPPVPALEPSPEQVDGQGPAKLHLYTAGTPNGYKASIVLEELRAAYPELAKNELSYDVSNINIGTNAQKHEDFLKINPNGRIPALVDDNAGGFDVFESASIILWLTSQYDSKHVLDFADPKLQSKALSWIFFAHGGVGPMQGQTHVFLRYAPFKIPFGIKRYNEETRRLYGVLEDGLVANGSGYLVGDKFSIADLNVFPWVRSHWWAGIDVDAEFPVISKWLKRISERPAVQVALQIPPAALREYTEEFKEQTRKDVKEFIDKANKEIEAAKAGKL